MFEGRGNLPRRRHPGKRQRPGDPELAALDECSPVHAPRRDDTVLAVGPGDQSQRQVDVVERPGKRSGGRQHPIEARPSWKIRDVAELRYQSHGRLEPVDTTEVRRHPDRATHVAPNIKRGEPGGERRTGAAARAAGCPRLVPWIVCPAEDRVRGLLLVRQQRGIGLAEQDSARRLQSGRDRRVNLRNVIAEGRISRRGANSLCRLGVLQRVWNAVERSPRFPSRGRLIRCSGSPGRALRIERHDRIERRVEPLDPFEIEPDQLRR